MVITNNNYAGEGQQRLQSTDPFSRERRRPTSTNPQLSDTNKNLVFGRRWGLTPRHTDRLTVGRNIRLTLTSSGFQLSAVEWSELVGE
jgi:hypothetical protein